MIFEFNSTTGHSEKQQQHSEQLITIMDCSSTSTIHCFVKYFITNAKTGKYNHQAMKRTCAAKCATKLLRSMDRMNGIDRMRVARIIL